MRRHLRVVLRPLRVLFGPEQSLPEIPVGEHVETTGNVIRANRPNAMAEVIWRQERCAAFVTDLHERTSIPRADVTSIERQRILDLIDCRRAAEDDPHVGSSIERQILQSFELLNN